MNNREKFVEWMINNSGRSKNTINKYASAIATMSRELTGQSIDIYKVMDSMEIDKIKEQYLEIDHLREKDERGNRMYTSSLIWYKKYLEEDQNINTLVKDNSDEYSIVYEKKAKGEFTTSEGTKQWKRDRAIVDRSIEFSNNKCEYDDEHEYFISNKSGKNYVEGHHLIPMKYQDDFEYSLDVEANVVSLCVVCHKILHLGKIEDKVKIISKLYQLRMNSLKLSGLEISLDDLIDLYK
ncbi:hypothetical protein JY742_18435 [Clostridioides difficile]|nr:hypothetical protein [Clostridioides difficile]